MAPRISDEALDRTWVVVRDGRRGGAVHRVGPGGERVELARSRRRLGVDRVGLATALLADALPAPPHYKLANDLATFVVPAGAGEVVMTGRELQAWLDTWQPPLEQLLPLRALRRRQGS